MKITCALNYLTDWWKILNNGYKVFKQEISFKCRKLLFKSHIQLLTNLLLLPKFSEPSRSTSLLVSHHTMLIPNFKPSFMLFLMEMSFLLPSLPPTDPPGGNSSLISLIFGDNINSHLSTYYQSMCLVGESLLN